MNILRFLDENAEKILCSVLLGGSCIIIFFQVILRVFGAPLSWTEEVARYMFIWLIYIGCSAAIRKRRHISLDLIDLFTGPKAQLVIHIFDNLVFLIFAIILAYYGWKVTMRVSVQVSAATRMNMALPYSSICISGVLMVIRLIQDTVKLIQEYKSREEVSK